MAYECDLIQLPQAVLNFPGDRIQSNLAQKFYVYASSRFTGKA